MKREEVVRGLTQCSREHRGLEDCSECPYKLKPGHYAGLECWCRLCDDALALLKEQEPRVLDEDEVFVTELSTVLYLERRRARETTRIVPAILMNHDTWCYGTLSSYRYAEFVHEGKLIDHRDLATYGVTWRAWSARPTEEQMEETPWEEVRRET